MRPSSFACGAFVLAAACVLTLALVPPCALHYPLIRLLLIAGIGLGIGASVTFASSTIMNAAPPERGGMAASIEEVGFELGNSLGVAVFGSVMTAAYAMSLVLPDSCRGTARRPCGIRWMKRCWWPIPWALKLQPLCEMPGALPSPTRCVQC